MKISANVGSAKRRIYLDHEDGGRIVEKNKSHYPKDGINLDFYF
jgi:hypothetical protein